MQTLIVLIAACADPKPAETAVVSSPTVEYPEHTDTEPASAVWTGSCTIDQVDYGTPTIYELVITPLEGGGYEVAATPEGYYSGIAEAEVVADDGVRLVLSTLYELDFGYTGSNWTLRLDGEVDGETWSGSCQTTSPGSYGVWGAPLGDGPFVAHR